jgi:hypothetical protein
MRAARRDAPKDASGDAHPVGAHPAVADAGERDAVVPLRSHIWLSDRMRMHLPGPADAHPTDADAGAADADAPASEAPALQAANAHPNGRTPATPKKSAKADTASAPASEDADAHLQKAAEVFADELAHGKVPTLRKIQKTLRVGQPRAQQVQAHLRALAS